MGCFEKFLNWLAFDNIPDTEKSIIRDLKTIGILEN
jgi:hypothetical protein